MTEIEYPRLPMGSTIPIKALYGEAIKGNVRSQIALAEAYSCGEQVEISLETAEIWRRIASENPLRVPGTSDPMRCRYG